MIHENTERRAHDAVVGRLAAYRRYITILASGGALMSEQADDMAEITDTLHLPLWGIARDVRAARQWQTGDMQTRAALLVCHPHVFYDADKWCREFLDQSSRCRAIHYAAADGEPDA